MPQSQTDQTPKTEMALAIRRPSTPVPQTDASLTVAIERRAEREIAKAMELQRWMDLSG